MSKLFVGSWGKNNAVLINFYYGVEFESIFICKNYKTKAIFCFFLMFINRGVEKLGNYCSKGNFDFKIYQLIVLIIKYSWKIKSKLKLN